jgi:hypothetical protein
MLPSQYPVKYPMSRASMAIPPQAHNAVADSTISGSEVNPPLLLLLSGPEDPIFPVLNRMRVHPAVAFTA